MDTTNTSTAYNLGCNQGNFDAGHSPPVSSEVALDFGGQLSNGSGTDMIRGGDITNGQIEAVAESFSQGYWDCTGNDNSSTLHLGIGTNNDIAVSNALGKTWESVGISTTTGMSVGVRLQLFQHLRFTTVQMPNSGR